MTHTSLGRMLTPVPYWFATDTREAINGRYSTFVVNMGNPWIDSPIFDRLAGERFGNATA